MNRARVWLTIAALMGAGLSLRVVPAWAAGELGWDTSWERWSYDRVGGESAAVQELTTRLVLRYRLSRSVTAEAAAGWLRATGDVTLSGLADTRVKLTYRSGDHLVVRAGFNLPTGSTALPPDELLLADALASRILAFDGSRVGEGSDLDLGVSYAFTAGPAAIGVGAGYLAKGEYDLIQDGGAYHPGNQLRMAAGADFGRVDWTWRTNFRALLYTEDQVDGEAFFRAGDRLEFQTILLRRFATTSLWVSGSVIRFGKAERMAGEALAGEQLRSQGNETYCDAGLRRSLSRRVSLTLHGGAGIFFANELGQGKGRRFEIASDLDWRPARGYRLELGLSVGGGRLDQLFPELDNAVESGLVGVRGHFGINRSF
jgi:hypothetical protein